MRIVLTGGPHAGKTTLIEELGRRGERVVPEAAIGVIAKLQRELGAERTTEWRRAHADEFQEHIARAQLELEAQTSVRPMERVFFDRGLFDGLAYCRLAGVAPPRTVVAASGERRYDLVVLCELVLPFQERGASGRTSDLPRARAIEAALEAVWTELGYPVWRLPADRPPGARAELLLERVAAEARAKGLAGAD
ncbi:MAG: ATP-binding protein [Planctomycetes bacterium]|nr:ATP-binding protein [Planctomycetota bacterium]